MDSLLTRTVHAKEITVVDDAAGRSVITVIGDKASKNKNKMKIISQSSTLPSNGKYIDGVSTAGVHMRACMHRVSTHP